jgi:hypothetical protein
MHTAAFAWPAVACGQSLKPNNSNPDRYDRILFIIILFACWLNRIKLQNKARHCPQASRPNAAASLCCIIVAGLAPLRSMLTHKSYAAKGQPFYYPEFGCWRWILMDPARRRPRPTAAPPLFFCRLTHFALVNSQQRLSLVFN